MKEITEKAIMRLRDEAGQAGDTLMAAICQMAVEGAVRPATWDALAEYDRNKFNRQFFTPQQAHAECTRVIRSAAEGDTT
jgi:hypothetical protein